MALSQSALLEILDVIKEADLADRVRGSAATLHPALIEVELTSVIGPTPAPLNTTVTETVATQSKGPALTDRREVIEQI